MKTLTLLLTLFTMNAWAKPTLDEALAKVRAKYAVSAQKDELKELQKAEREQLKLKQKTEREALKGAR
jgi:hypothetical protein